MRSTVRIALPFVVVAACSGASKNTPNGSKTQAMTPKDIVAQSSPAIVRVETTNGADRGVGTGFILDKTGLIATNLHVVRGNKDIKVKLYGGEVYQVQEIMGIDPNHDLALLKIQPKKALPTVRLGDSDAMVAGDQVVAIGNPLGVFEYTVSAGLVSQVRPICTAEMVKLHDQHKERFEELAKKARELEGEGRRLGEDENTELEKLSCVAELKFLQISAPISQGSSGGPLFNQRGEVVGVTTLIVTEGQNINLAIPGNYLKPIIARPAVISLDEFVAKTGTVEDDKVVRAIPDHPLAVFDGCTREQIGTIVKGIGDAIEVGAPLYNEGDHQACYKIYEHAARGFVKDAPCKGVAAAFEVGLRRADGMKNFKLKAWAMRDTFDGLTEAARRWARANLKP